MHTLFNLNSPIGQGILTHAEWPYVRDGLRRNLQTVVSFYSRRPMAVKSGHLLERLLTAITTPHSQPIERYYDNVDITALNVAMALGLTSSIFAGRVHHGIFYGPGTQEIIIAHREDFNPAYAERNWQYLQPVQVLRHPRSDLTLNIPDGSQTGIETGMAVIAVNVPMLAVQYRSFRKAEIEIAADQESQRSIMQFLHMYPLTNMLYTHLDQVVFNRINNLRLGKPMGITKKPHSFFLTDYGPRMNRIQSAILKSLENVGKDFRGILRTVPGVIDPSMDEAMRLPDTAPTRQVLWGLVISRLPALGFLMEISKGSPDIRNRQEVNRILRSVRLYRNENLMRQMLPRDLYVDIQREILDAVGEN